MAQPPPAADGQRTTEPSTPPTVAAMPSVTETSTAASPSAPPTTDAVPPTALAVPDTEAEDASPETTMVDLPTAAAPPLPSAEEWLNMTFKWSGKAYDVRVSTSDLVFDLRSQIESLTSVPPDAQKILGLGRGKLSTDSDGQRIGTLGLKDGAKFTLVGTPEHLRFKEREGPPPLDEWDLAYPTRGRDLGASNALPPALDPRNVRRVEQIIRKREITVMNEPRPGKRLLVLDLDYTIADTRPLLDGALPPLECARPGLNDFLHRVYPHYDIVVWSQTHWMWLESKLVELGVLGGGARYQICFVADRTSMFPIFSERGGQMVKHEVKPLAYFWARFPHWSSKNTIHIDDLARNFALNPSSGLKIRAFKTAGTAEGRRDRELYRLGDYLVEIAQNVEDFTTLDHAQWKKRRSAMMPRMDDEPAGEEPGSSSGGGSGGGPPGGPEAPAPQ